MFDFAIILNNGMPEMTYAAPDNIFNNVYLSLAVKRGSFFFNPSFGSRFHLLKKNTARAEKLADAYAREALQWLVDTGRASSFDVMVERDMTQDVNRLKMLVEVTDNNGEPVVYTYFIEVV